MTPCYSELKRDVSVRFLATQILATQILATQILADPDFLPTLISCQH